MGERTEAPMGASLAGKMVAVMQAIGHVPKNGFNQRFNYAYALDADVLDAVRKALVENRVAAYTSVVEREDVPLPTRNGSMNMTRVTVETTFVDADSGESCKILTKGDGSDAGDKAVFKAITGAVKYALMKQFLIATGDDPERDDDADDASSRGRGDNGSGKSTARQQSSDPQTGTMQGAVEGVFNGEKNGTFVVALKGGFEVVTSSRDLAVTAAQAKKANAVVKVAYEKRGDVAALKSLDVVDAAA
ncbi:ERF family protein [Candidatus Binatia bacterium]|nr:ERF family protein [Candidatus Binatia bacterium]